MNNELPLFHRVWERVRKRYETEFMVYERGLQAALYMELYTEFPDWAVVVEPEWKINESRVKPDLVIVRDGEIADIFELKFHPWWCPPFDPKIKNDIDKLLSYQGERDVMLNPYDGSSDGVEPLPIRPDCGLHFVVVSRPGENIPDPIRLWLPQISDRILLWYGIVNLPNPQWGIRRGEL